MSKAQAFLQHFNSHRSVLPKLLNHLNDSNLTYRPWEDGFTTKDLLWHMLSSSYGMANAAAGGTAERITDKPNLDTVEQIKAITTDLTDKTLKCIESMSDEQFGAEIDMTKIFGRTVIAEQLLTMMLDHEIHHKGQLFTYARLCGATELPMFTNPSGK